MFVNNASSNVALQALRGLSAQIEETSQRVATGQRVSSAADSPSYWSIAEKLGSQASALEVVRDSISVGRATLQVANAGLDGAQDNLQKVRDLLVQSKTAGIDRGEIQTQIAGYLTDLGAKANTAEVNGENLLSIDSSAAGFNATASIVGSFSSGAGGVNVTTIDVTKADVALIDPAGGTAAGILDQDRTVGGTTTNVLTIDISALTDSTADQTTIDETIAIVDAALQDTIDAQTVIGTALNRAESQESFLSAQIDAQNAAVSGLVSADLESESARLSALQTQQQLAVTALGISNASVANILQLFR